MKNNPSTFTDFVDKESFFNDVAKHVDVMSIGTNKIEEEAVFLWATEIPNERMQIRSLTKREPVKNILVSSSSDARESIRRLFDQILFESDRKFGGSAELALSISNSTVASFMRNHKGQFLTDKVKEWLTYIFEEVVPNTMAPYALPNTSSTFAEALAGLCEVYEEELLAASIKAVMMAGSGGNIIVQQSPYYETFSVKSGGIGYQFKTIEKSKMFIGQQRFSQSKAVSFSNPKLLLVNGAIEDFSEIEELLDEAAKTKQPFVVIAERISDEIFDVFKLNFDKGVVDCFALETINDYIAVNTITDLSVIAGTVPITPYTMYSEFLLAKWEALPTINEIIINKDGKVTLINAETEMAVKEHIKNIAIKRQEVTIEEFSIKEPNFTARIQNLTTSPTYLYVPYKTEAEGETKKLKVDTLLRYMKSIISYGVLDLREFDVATIMSSIKKKMPISERQMFESHQWFFESIFIETKSITPYIYIIGARRLIANHLAQIFGVGGIIVAVE